MSSMERCSFDEIDNLIRSSHHSATPTITDSLIVDDATRNITDKSQNIRFDNIRDQLKIFSERLSRVEQSRSTRTISNTDSRPAASRSVPIENSSTTLSERFQAQQEINRPKLELAIPCCEYRIIFCERLSRVEQSRSTRTISNTDSRPAASRSVQIKNSSTIWSERFQVQEGIYHPKLELAIARS
ncbi:unnamed protein product [Rotaria magnacalcarata]|uniref:Uncharacterized protein n=1 Tax=Rotaria magnacalcarata TaxID=392030 RepID=A0A816XKB2_9BILA|nr:unnamed protein product [Rotaria magnacalcarata]